MLDVYNIKGIIKISFFRLCVFSMPISPLEYLPSKRKQTEQVFGKCGTEINSLNLLKSNVRGCELVTELRLWPHGCSLCSFPFCCINLKYFTLRIKLYVTPIFLVFPFKGISRTT